MSFRFAAGGERFDINVCVKKEKKGGPAHKRGKHRNTTVPGREQRHTTTYTYKQIFLANHWKQWDAKPGTSP